MPVTANQNDRFEVRLEGRIDGQLTNNVWHFEYLSGASDTDVALHLIQVFLDCFTAHLLPVLTSSWSLERVVWKRVSPTLGPELITVPTGTLTGGGNAAALPSFNSAVISKRTLLGGRSKRGRTYIAGIPENQTTNSTMDPALPLWLGLLAFCACMVSEFIPGDPVGSNSWGMMVYSRKIGGATFPYGAAGFEQIRELVPVSFLGTTRSRKVGRGA